jgi:hypothetical protein
VRIYDPANVFFLEPRTDTCEGSVTAGSQLLYAAQPQRFPAHSFLPDGSMRAPDGRQRLRFRVGARPDMTYKDRFHTNPDTDAIGEQPVQVQFAGTLPEEVRLPAFDDGDPDTDNYADIDVWIELFVPTGRVKLLP